jgi:hypothetical protein
VTEFALADQKIETQIKRIRRRRRGGHIVEEDEHALYLYSHYASSQILNYQF